MRDQKNQSIAKQLAALSVSALVTFAMSGCAVRQTAAHDPGSGLRVSAMTRPSAPQATGAEEYTASGPNGTHEGIKVHGHWTIEVRNPDGALASHREFENSLLGVPASQALVAVLSRAQSVGLWIIVFNNLNGVDPCPLFCHILEPNSTFPADASDFKNLMVSTASNGTQLVLSGSATASQNGSINNVVTQTEECASSILPSNCLDNNGLFFASFTGTAISPIAVLSGQIIQVTVTISFS